MTEPSAARGPAGVDPQKIVAFVTGKLASASLRSMIKEIAPSIPFETRIVSLNIAVAALMTTEWIVRHIQLPDGVEELLLPGYCRGNLEALERALGVKAKLGPRDLRDLPGYFGRESMIVGYGKFDIEIIAEINHVPQLEEDEVVSAALRYAADGADTIDLGCDPGGPFTAIGDRVRRLKDEGLRVSIDSLDPREIVPAVDAGADLALSVNSQNISVARELGCEVVVIPDDTHTMAGLHENIAQLEAWGVKYRVDPVLEPIAFGFARSLGRYIEIRDRYPDANLMMGIGNLTELTDADSAPINTILLGFCQELAIRSVLTTEVISWARSSVKECDLARRLVYFACKNKMLPKRLEPDLHLLRDERVLEHGSESLDAMSEGIRDKNFRIFAERGEIHVISRKRHLRGTNPYEIFAELGEVEDPSHAFYLGFEMSKAFIALALGKSYEQDETLNWGFLTPEEPRARGNQPDTGGETRD